MPYTCAFTGYVCVASVASRGCSHACVCHRGATPRRWRRGGNLSLAVCHQGATAGRPGERAAAERSLAQSARALPAVAALLLLMPQPCSLACASERGLKRRKNHVCSKFDRLIAFGRRFFALCSKGFKMGARACLLTLLHAE